MLPTSARTLQVQKDGKKTKGICYGFFLGKFVLHTVQLLPKLVVRTLEHHKMFSLAESGEWQVGGVGFFLIIMITVAAFHPSQGWARPSG